MPILYLAVAVTRVGFGVIILIFPVYILGASDVSAAIALALYPVLEAVFAVPIGRLCDSRGRKSVFAAALGFMALFLTGISLTRNLEAVAILHALMGVSAAGVTVSSLTMITDLTHFSNRGKGMGAFDFANLGGYAIGIFVGGRLIQLYNNDLGFVFILTAVVIATALLLGVAILHEPPHEMKRGSTSINPLKAIDSRTKAILPLWLAVTTLIGLVFYLPRVLRDVGTGPTFAADVLLVGVTVIGIGSVGFGALSDRLGRERVTLIGVVGMMGLLLTLATSLTGPFVSSDLIARWYLLGPFALMTSALVPSILATVGDRTGQAFRGSAMGLYSMMLSAGIAVGTLLAGIAHSRGGLPAILDVAVVVFATCALVSYYLLRRTRTKP